MLHRGERLQRCLTEASLFTVCRCSSIKITTPFACYHKKGPPTHTNTQGDMWFQRCTTVANPARAPTEKRLKRGAKGGGEDGSTLDSTTSCYQEYPKYSRVLHAKITVASFQVDIFQFFCLFQISLPTPTHRELMNNCNVRQSRWLCFLSEVPMRCCAAT